MLSIRKNERVSKVFVRLVMNGYDLKIYGDEIFMSNNHLYVRKSGDIIFSINTYFIFEDIKDIEYDLKYAGIFLRTNNDNLCNLYCDSYRKSNRSRTYSLFNNNELVAHLTISNYIGSAFNPLYSLPIFQKD